MPTSLYGGKAPRCASLLRSFAVGASMLIVYIGLCHEFVGAIVFPFGPAMFGGPAGWHAFGLLTIVVGGLLLAGVLELARVPVAALSLLVAVVGLALAWYTGVAHQRCHFFALSAVLAAVVVAFCHRVGRTDERA